VCSSGELKEPVAGKLESGQHSDVWRSDIQSPATFCVWHLSGSRQQNFARSGKKYGIKFPRKSENGLLQWVTTAKSRFVMTTHAQSL
jgi:hypothetical protein